MLALLAKLEQSRAALTGGRLPSSGGSLMFNQLVTWPFLLVTWAHRKVTGRDDKGASLVEYALLLALIAIVAAGAVAFLGTTVGNTINNVTKDITSTVPVTG
jgi:Flp pilus assembly pilin Flp